MPDIPVEIEGNSEKFTISTQATTDATGVRTVLGDTFNIDPGGALLQMRLTNSVEVDLTVALGERWSIIIEQQPQPIQR